MIRYTFLGWGHYLLYRRAAPASLSALRIWCTFLGWGCYFFYRSATLALLSALRVFFALLGCKLHTSLVKYVSMVTQPFAASMRAVSLRQINVREFPVYTDGLLLTSPRFSRILASSRKSGGKNIEYIDCRATIDATSSSLSLSLSSLSTPLSKHMIEP